MADLIELDVVVRDKTLKTSISTVERLERQIIKAQKAVDQNAISQTRYNQILLSAKRGYETLGVSSQKATAQVRAFAAANKTSQAAVAAQTTSINSQTAAIQRNASHVNQAKRQTNQLGVLMQQTGYQVGDFAVQVQSGTNYMVAFGQQATQLIGTFSMLAKSTKMIAIFSGLGIAVPILSAIGAYFVRASESAEGASEKIKTFEDRLRSSESAITSVDSAITNLSDKSLESLRKRYGEVTTQVVELEEALKSIELKALTSEVQEAMNSLFSPEFFTEVESAFGAIGSAIAETTEEDLVGMRREISLMQQQLDNGLLAPEDLILFEELKEELAAATGDLENMGSLVDKLTIPEKVIATYKELETRIKSATEKGNFEQAAEGISAMRKLFADLGLEVESGALANMTRLERILREANISLGDGTALAMTLTQAFGLAVDEAQRLAINLQSAVNSSEQVASTNISVMTAQMQALNKGQDQYVAGASKRLSLEKDLYKTTLVAAGLSTKEAELAADANFKNREALIGVTAEYRKASTAATKSGSSAKKGMSEIERAMKDAEKAAEALQKQLDQPLINAIDGVSNAFGDFVARGLKDFKGFVQQILGSFTSMISQMIATAARNKIMLSMGIGGTGIAGKAAGIGGSAGPLSSFMGSFGSAGVAGTGLLGGAGAAMPAFLGGAGNGMFAVGANAAAAGGGIAASIGAAIPPLLAVTAVLGLFMKKTKVLDTGLRATVDGFDVAIETFEKTQTSRLFGLLKGKKKTGYSGASAEVADPLVKAVGEIQQSVLEAADTLGIGADAFDNFSYQFKVSLKGLSEEEQFQKVTQELNKMGDSFASLSGHFENMNELLAAANKRMELRNRMDTLLNNNAAVLTRQREAELSAMHALNRPLAQAVYQLEDTQSVVTNAFAALRASIDSVVSDLKDKLGLANEAMNKSKSIYETLSDALRSRKVSGDEAFSGRRESAVAFLSKGVFGDERKLQNALGVVAEPSEQLFGSFVDYARDFGLTGNVIAKAAETAKVQLSADEQAVELLETQIETLNAQLQMMVSQYNALLGIDTSVKSVADAMSALRSALRSFASAQGAAKATASARVPQPRETAAALQEVTIVRTFKGGNDAFRNGASGVELSNGQIFKTESGWGDNKEIQNATKKARESVIAAGGIPKFATGGMHSGGLRMVGERGPELEATGPSRIFSHNQTSGLFKDPDLKEAVNELRREVSGLRDEQRQMGAASAKYAKRNYDINRKWDTDGLPTTRT